MIQINHVKKAIGGHVIFDDLSMQIADREFAVLTGSSGCGKTTMLRIIGGFETPDTVFLALCVLGGIFSEGIDLPGARLIGTAVVGVGLPQVNPAQEALRAWYTYTMDFLNGNITIEEWAEKHNENQLRYLPDVMAASEISDADLENPQNEPTGN